MKSFMRGLDLYRKAGDNQGAAAVSHAMGLTFETQGRIGPAIGALQDSVKTLRGIGDRSANMAETVNDLADALAKGGAGAQSAPLITEAQELAKGLKNEALQASILNSQGDVSYYQGDLKSAKNFYDQAERLASHSSNKDVLLTSKLNGVRVDIADGRARGATSELKGLIQQADAQGRKYISIAASALMGEALVADKQYTQARQELERALGRSEKLGTRLITARVHYVLGNLARLTGDASEAKNQFLQTKSLVDEVAKEQGAEHLSDRSDIKQMYQDATK